MVVGDDIEGDTLVLPFLRMINVVDSAIQPKFCAARP
jgi:hypothetical protein